MTDIIAAKMQEAGRLAGTLADAKGADRITLAGDLIVTQSELALLLIKERGALRDRIAELEAKTDQFEYLCASVLILDMYRKDGELDCKTKECRDALKVAVDVARGCGA